MVKASQGTFSVPEWCLFLGNKLVSFDQHVVCFVGSPESVSIYISYFLSKQKQVQTIELEQSVNQAYVVIHNLLSMTFLGKACIYFIKTHFNCLVTKDVEKILLFLSRYQGPHQLFFLASDDIVKKYKVKNTYLKYIDIPDHVSYDQVRCGLLYSGVSETVTHYLLKSCSVKQEFSLSFFITLLMYAPVLGKLIISDFINVYFPLLVSENVSLFDLSKKFFAQDRSFFRDWVVIEKKYQPVFWTTFWFDQCNKAALYCLYKKNRQQNDAQMISNGLPFSFINNDWKLYNPLFLASYAQKFYELDVMLKTETVYKHLDILFINVFSTMSTNNRKIL